MRRPYVDSSSQNNQPLKKLHDYEGAAQATSARAAAAKENTTVQRCPLSQELFLLSLSGYERWRVRQEMRI